MPERRERTFENFDDYNARCAGAGWELEWRPLSSADQRVHWDAVALPVGTVLRLRSRAPFYAEYGRSPITPLYLPIETGGPLHVNGHHLDHGSMGVLDRSRGGFVANRGVTDVVELDLPGALVADFAPGHGVWTVRPVDRARLLAVAGRLLSRHCPEPDQHALEDAALRLMIGATRPRHGHRTAAIVARARQAAADGCRTVAELVAATSTSRATLYRAFDAELGTSPHRWLAARRLYDLRSKLLDPRHADRTVTQLATDLGIGHLGRMAADYRRTFGELPSETRR